MKKQAKDIKKEEKIIIAGKAFIVQNIEISDIGKQGKRKVRFELKTTEGEKTVIIRPEDYPFETK